MNHRSYNFDKIGHRSYNFDKMNHRSGRFDRFCHRSYTHNLTLTHTCPRSATLRVEDAPNEGPKSLREIVRLQSISGDVRVRVDEGLKAWV